MGLKEFLEKFLPDSTKKYIEERKKPLSVTDDDMINYFEIALQNFADEICERQRRLSKIVRHT